MSRYTIKEARDEMNNFSREIFDEIHNMDTFQNVLQRHILNFVERPIEDFVDAPESVDDFIDWCKKDNVREDMKLLSYLTSNVSEVPNLKNSVPQEIYEKMVLKAKALQNTYIFATNTIDLIKDENYLKYQFNEYSDEEIENLDGETAENDNLREMVDMMVARKDVRVAVLNQKARIDSLSIVESLKNRKGNITDEEVINDFEDYEEIEVDDEDVLFDRTARNAYHYFDNQGHELLQNDAQERIRNGEQISRYKGARTEGVTFNVWNDATHKLETKESHREFNYPVQEDMKENIRMLKDLQKDLSSTDPWCMTTNTEQFKNLKKSINIAIKAMEQCAKYPIDNNMNNVATAMRNLNVLSDAYARRKHVEALQSGKERDQKRYNIATELRKFSSAERVKAMKSKVFHVDPAKVIKKLEEKYPKDGNIKDVANYLRGLTELSKMIPQGKENREDKVGISYIMADVVKGLGSKGKELLINQGGMTKNEMKELEKQFNLGKPTKDEMSKKVGDGFLERSGVLNAPEEDMIVEDEIRILE